MNVQMFRDLYLTLQKPLKVDRDRGLKRREDHVPQALHRQPVNPNDDGYQQV
jgi:hypothetical protein